MNSQFVARCAASAREFTRPTNRTACRGTRMTGAFLCSVILTAGTPELSQTRSQTPGVVVAWGEQVIPYVQPGTRFTALAAGMSRSLALTGDGTVVAWGEDDSGQSTVPAGLSGVVAVAAGDYHNLAVKSDGTVVAWGDNSSGQSTVPVGLRGVVAVAAGGAHSLALREDGTVVAWGDNERGQSKVPAGLSGVVAVAAGEVHSLALKSDGTVAAWGDNSSGQSTVPAGLSKVVAVAAGTIHSLALKSDGTVASWGDNSHGESTVPAGLSGVVAVAAGGYHSLALKSDARVAAWGDNSMGESTVPAGLSLVVAVAAGDYHNLALKSDGTVVAWGDNYSGQSTAPTGLTGVLAVAAGGGGESTLVSEHSLALKSDGTIVAWGDNGYGESTVPAGLSRVLAAAAGGLHSLALKSDGTVVAWGDNYYGESTVPAGLSGAGAVAVAAGVGHSLALKSDGTVVAWGRNDGGQSTVPAGLSGVAAVAAGWGHSLALKSDGAVVAWGDNSHGQSTVPVGLRGVVAVAAGLYHSLALKSDGTVVAWGSNNDPGGNYCGQSTVPAGLSGVVAVAAGEDHSLALKSDGTVVAWGSNSFGESTVPVGLSGVVAVAAGGSDSLAIVASAQPPPPGCSFADDYPLASAPFCPESTPSDQCPGDTVDPWGFFNRECTSYVAWKLNEAAGTATSPFFFSDYMMGGHWGDAENWDVNALALGFKVDSVPAVGAIAQWHASDLGPNGAGGHVAYVEAVNLDGSVNVSEYNYHLDHSNDTRCGISPPRFIHILQAQAGLSNVRASQRPGTTLVDLFYDLSGNGSAYAASVSVSSDAGASFTVPATHFTGDGVASPTLPGTGLHIVWDAGADFPGQFSTRMRLQLIVNGTASAVSPIFTLDTRAVPTGTLTGNVLGNSAPVANAQVRIKGTVFAGNTDSSGAFALNNVPAASGYLVTVAAAGFASKQVPGVTVTAATTDMGTITLAAVGGPSHLVALAPDVNPGTTTVEVGGTAYRYYLALNSANQPQGGVTVSAQVSGGNPIPQSGDVSAYWPGQTAGVSDADGVVRVSIPASDLGALGVAQTVELSVAGQVQQTFQAEVALRQYDQTWTQKLGGGVSVGDLLSVEADSSAESEVRHTVQNGAVVGESISRTRQEKLEAGVGFDVGSSISVELSPSIGGAGGASASAGAGVSVGATLRSTFSFAPDTTDARENAMKLYVDLGNVLSGLPGPQYAFYQFVETALEPIFFGSNLRAIEGDAQAGLYAAGALDLGFSSGQQVEVGIDGSASWDTDAIAGYAATFGAWNETASVVGWAASAGANLSAQAQASLGSGDPASQAGGAYTLLNSGLAVKQLRKNWTRQGEGAYYRSEEINQVPVQAGHQTPISAWQQYDSAALYQNYPRQFTETFETTNGIPLTGYNLSVSSYQPQNRAGSESRPGIRGESPGRTRPRRRGGQ